MVIIETTIPCRGTYGTFPAEFLGMVTWMQDNVGEMYVDWKFTDNGNQKYIHLLIEDDAKATLVKLRWT